MTVRPHYIDLEHIDDVSDIDPAPMLAVNEEEGERRLGPIGDAGRRIMLELLDSTDATEPFGERVFGRLGLDWRATNWRGWDLYWAAAEREDVVDALKRWNAAHSA